MSRKTPAILLFLVHCTSAGSGDTGTTAGSSGGAVPEDSSSSTAGPAPTTSSTGGDGSSSTGGGEATSTGAPVTSGETGPTLDMPGETGWRSALYPEDWTPGFMDGEGRFLHDFSYAGYRNGEAELAQDVPGKMIDVVADHMADNTGTGDATAAFQAALDAAAMAGGAVVSVPAGLYRIDGELAVTGSRTVLRGEGAEQSRLWFTKFMGMSYKSHIQVGGALQLTDESLLTEDGAARSFTVKVADAGAYKAGDDVAIGWVITPEFVAEHAMDGVWMVFNDEWQVFFWRTVVGVDGDTLTLDVPLRYPALLRDQASVKRVDGYLREVGIEDLGLADAVGWDDAWSQDQVHLVSLRGVKDAWVRGVASFESPGAPDVDPGKDRHLQSSGIEVVQGKRVTIADSTLGFAQHRGDGGNGYLFEVSMSSEVLVRDCLGDSGRHNFIQNWGFGATGIVWLRIHSVDGKAVAIKDSEFGLPGLSEFHHSLATANLIDQSTLDDGWGAVNRGDYSSGAGHSATQSAVWNPQGGGVIRSRQFGHGYVIGPGPDLSVETAVDVPEADGTEPEDWLERAPEGVDGPLTPMSLYEDQLARRLGG